MTTYLLVRENKVAMRLQDAKLSGGKIYTETRRGDAYALDGKLADAEGQLSTITKLARDGNYAAIDRRYLVGLGTSDSGLLAIEESEWRARPKKAAPEQVPGLNAFRAALADEARYQSEFRRMMGDGNNDGVSAPRPVATTSESAAKEFPLAAAFHLASEWSLANHDVKSSAGTAAKKQLLAGDGIETVLAEMEAVWSNYCNEEAKIN